MEFVHWILHTLRDPSALIDWFGPYAYVGLGAVIFAETGALVFFLPGDSLLFVAGLYATQGHFNIFLLNALLMVCAIVGDALSYTIGKQLGSALFNRKDAKLLKPEHLESARAFYEKHGGKAIILARFVPIVRTFVPVVAGAAQMGYRKFATFNIIGGVSWIFSMTIAGYFLGQFEIVGKNLEKVVIGIVLVSVLPIIFEMWKARSASKNAA